MSIIFSRRLEYVLPIAARCYPNLWSLLMLAVVYN